MPLRRQDLALAIVATFLLGFNFVVVKTGVAHFPPLLMMAVRFSIVALVLAWFVRSPTGRWRAVFLLSITMGTLHFGLFFIGISGVDASVAAIVFQLGIVFSVVFARLFLGEVFGVRRTVGMVVAFGGVSLIAGITEGSSNINHLLIVMASMVAWGFAAVQIRQLRDVRPMTLAAWIAIFSAPQFFVISAVLETGQVHALETAGALEWGTVVFSALGASIAGYGLWYYLIGKYAVSAIMPFAFLNPLFAIASSVVILGEDLSPVRLAGAGITLAGVAIIQWQTHLLKPGQPTSGSQHGSY